MFRPRRLVASLAASALAWVGLTVVVAIPAAHADVQPPHDPATYYAGTEGLSGTALALQLNSIIDGHTTVPYTSGATDVWDALDVLDQDPNDATKVIDVYSGDSLVLTNKCGSSCPLDGWNREHTWAQSRGSFDTAPGPGTDLFHMRVSRGNTNSSRGNLDFDETVGGSVPGCPSVCTRDGDSFEPRENIKGDVARGLFYMDVRYNGDADDGFGVNLRMWDQVGSSSSQIGKLSTLVAWSLADPPDDRERWRNDKIDGDYQHNRNPFIDHPEWVCAIWPTAACGTGGSNQPPTTSPMTKTTVEDTATTVTLSASDPNSDPLTWSVGQAAAHGTAGVTGSTLSYTPAQDFHGTDVVGVTVSDGHGGTASTTVTITVTPVNDAPVADPVSAATTKNTSKDIALAGSDVDGDSLTYALVGEPSQGTVVVNGATATYTPPTDFTGAATFSYAATDPGVLTSPSATVTVTVASSQQPPVPTAVVETTDEDEPVTFALTATDPNGDPLTFAIQGQPAHGSASVLGNQATYTPAANYHGPDAFTWTVSDGTDTVSSSATLTVTSVNDVPGAIGRSATTDEDTTRVFFVTASDADGDPRTYALDSQPEHGTVALTGAGQVTYTPAPDYHGPDSFTFTASDAESSSLPATVSVTVASVEDAPAAAPASATTAEDTATTVNLLGSDGDGDALTYALGAQPAHGSVSLVGDQATYTPTANYHGPDSFTWTVSDGKSATTGTGTVTVTSVNDQPSVQGAQLQTTLGSPVTVTLPSADVDGDPVAISAVGSPGGGSVTYSGTTLTYRPSRAGTDAFVVTVSDSNGGTATAQVGVAVAKAAPTLGLSAGKLKPGKKGTIKVAVTGVPGSLATGVVTLKVGTKRLTANVVNGVATFRTAKLPDKARLKVTATYAGDGQYLGGSAKRTFKLKG